MRGVSKLGSIRVVIPLVVAICGVMVAVKWRWEPAILLGGVIVAQVVTLIVKQLVARPRPTADVVQVLEGAASRVFDGTMVWPLRRS